MEKSCDLNKKQFLRPRCKIAVKNLLLKFMYSEKAQNFCEISTVDLSYTLPVKSTVGISKNCMACSEYMNFKISRHSVTFD